MATASMTEPQSPLRGPGAAAGQPAPGAAAAKESPVLGGDAGQRSAEQALVPAAEPAGDPVAEIPPALEPLPVELDVCVPVRGFRVRNLLALEAGQVIESLWNHGDDVPLTAGTVQLAWSEFEVIENELAVRVTRLA